MTAEEREEHLRAGVAERRHRPDPPTGRDERNSLLLVHVGSLTMAFDTGCLTHLATNLRIAIVDTASFNVHTLELKAYLHPTAFPGLLHTSPPSLCALLDCACACAHGSTVDDPEDARLKPIAEVLRALCALLPDPGLGVPQLTVDMSPSLEALAEALIDTAHAERRRPKPGFVLMNAAWRLLLRVAATLLRLLGAAPASAAPLVDCLLTTLSSAFRAGDPTVAADLKVAAFHTSSFKVLLRDYAPWLTEQALCRTPLAAEAVRVLAVAYNRSDVVPCAATRRRLRSTLDACVRAILSTRAADGSATAPSTVAQWTSLTGTAETANSSLPGRQPDDGVMLLLLAAVRAPTLGSRVVKAPMAGLATVATIDNAFPAWLSLLPRCYSALLVPSASTPEPALHGIVSNASATPSITYVRLLDEASVVLPRLPYSARAVVLSSLIDASCAPHVLTRHAALTLWAHAIKRLDDADIVQLAWQLVVIATRFDPRHAHHGTARARCTLLTLVSTSCHCLRDSQQMGRLLLPARALDCAAVPPAEDAGGASVGVAVEFLEALTACLPSVARTTHDAQRSGGDHPEGGAKGSAFVIALRNALEVAQASSGLSALHGALHGESFAPATTLLRGVASLIYQLPEDRVPDDVRTALPARVILMLAGLLNEDDAATVCVCGVVVKAIIGCLTPVQRGALLRTARTLLPPATSLVYVEQEPEKAIMHPIPPGDRATSHAAPSHRASSQPGGDDSGPLPFSCMARCLPHLFSLVRAVASYELSAPALIALTKLLEQLYPLALPFSSSDKGSCAMSSVLLDEGVVTTVWCMSQLPRGQTVVRNLATALETASMGSRANGHAALRLRLQNMAPGNAEDGRKTCVSETRAVATEEHAEHATKRAKTELIVAVRIL